MSLKNAMLLLTVCLGLSGCMHTYEPVNSESNESCADIPELHETAVETESDTAAQTYEESEAELTLPEIIFSLDDGTEQELRESIEDNEEFISALAEEASVKFSGHGIKLRLIYLYRSITAGGEADYYSGSYEAYRADDEISPANYIGASSFSFEYSDVQGYIVSDSVVVTENDEIIRRRLKYGYQTDEESEVYFSLDGENRILLHKDGAIIETELYYYGSIGSVYDCNLVSVSGDDILICGREGMFFSTPTKISVSRDGGESWTTTIPTLEPLGADGQHIEAGFSEGIIQHTDDGEFFVFLNTNLSSMTVLKVPAGSCEAEVSFRAQIGGYETTSLIDAAMVSETRGFYTLAHPKYAASNAIYRTTDGGMSWVRCSVPMPEQVSDPWTMALYLPERRLPQSDIEWSMRGVWDGGECVYFSDDGGWTWYIADPVSE